ncbi:MAG TPA: hypothetical protein VMN38_12525 [Sphingomicrobium sp.]|nr:hypothetical protein [Sphingomicrobium sp.]
MESDIRYFRRRAHEELGAASRAVTEAARQRRLQLVDLYVRRLNALEAPAPFSEREFDRALGSSAGTPCDHSAFAWPGAVNGRQV